MSQTSMFAGVRPPGESHANRGMEFEKELQWLHAVYERQGIAKMDKQYVPSLPVKDGKWAKVIGKAVVDFSGEMAGGQHVAFDAKDCAGKRIELDRLKPHQLEHLEGVERLGGVGFVLVRFERRRVYRIPVRAWRAAIEAHRRSESVYDAELGWTATGKASISEGDVKAEWRVDGVDWVGRSETNA